MSKYFDHEKLDVYKAAIAFVILVDEKIRFYRMAKRSATECASILDICNQLQLIGEQLFRQGRSLLLRIVAMLIKLSCS